MISISRNLTFKNIYISIETGLVAITAFFIGHKIVKICHGGYSLIGGFWCMICAVVVLQSFVDTSMASARQRFYSCLIGIISSGMVCALFGNTYFALFIAISLSVFITRMLKYYQGTRIVSTQAGDVVALSILFPQFALMTNLITRTLETIAGILIALIAVWLSKKLLVRGHKNGQKK